MKKIIYHSVFLFGILALAASCKKESFNDRQTATTINETVSAKIAANQSYQMDLTNAGIVTINKQASHFLVSQTVIDNVKGGPTYTYTPAKDFIGNDEVVLLASKTVMNTSYNTGSGCHSGQNVATSFTSNKYITVKITVGN
jgi:hypothetical protein